MTSDSESSFDAMLREAAELRVPATDWIRLPELGELLQDKYRIEEKLGEGGMGAVFRATNVENGKAVAVKWLLGRSAKACARFSREGQVAARIDHPNVVNVFDLGMHRGGHFLVMELLRGQSLGARMRSGPLEAASLVEIMIPVLRGVAAAHAAGIVHRDLKPDNVFLCVGPDGAARAPKVLDFGISKMRTTTPFDERLTSEGTGLGTLAYMSPEQLVDAPNVDERTDIYAAGVMMYEALVARLPFHAESYNALVLAIAAQKPLPMGALVPNVPVALERIVTKAMAKEAVNRHADVQTLIDELEAWLSFVCAVTRAPRYAEEHRRVPDPVSPPSALARASGFRRWRVTASAVTACLAAWWLLGRAPEPEGGGRAKSAGSIDSMVDAHARSPEQVETAASARELPADQIAAEDATAQSVHDLASRLETSAVPLQAVERVAGSAAPKPSDSTRVHGTAARERAKLSPSGPLRFSDL